MPYSSERTTAVSSISERNVVEPTSRAEPAPRDREAEEFLLRLGRRLHGAGAPSFRLEDALSSCASSWGVEAQFFSTPTSLFAAFGVGSDQTTHLARLRPGEVDLGRMVELDELLDAIDRDGLTPRASLARLETLERSGARYGARTQLAAFVVASGSAAVFFGGGPGDVLATLGIGTLLGFLAHALQRSSASMQVFEPLAAFLAASAACLLHWLFPEVSDQVTTLSALIILVPGLMVTVGLSETATGHWVSGTARATGAVAVFLSLGIGIALGRHLGSMLPGFVSAEPMGGMPDAALFVALMISTVAFTILFRARLRDLPWIMAAGWVSFLGARGGSIALGPELGSFVGALCVGCGSNLYARWQRRPALVTQLPGIMLLVPGSIGFQSLSSFLAQDAITGIDAAFRMALVAAALVGGLFCANAVIPPRRSL